MTQLKGGEPPCLRPSHDRWMLAAVLLVTLLAFYPGLNADFCFDDEFVIVRNSTIQKIETLPRVFLQPYWDKPVQEYLFRPLTSLTYGINWILAGNSPRSFHLVNLLLHLLNLFLMTRLLMKHYPHPYLIYPVSCLWAVHPLLTENVVYTVGRADLMVGTCTLALLLTRKKAWIIVWVSLALLCKESALILPLLIILRDLLIPEHRAGGKQHPDGQLYTLLLVMVFSLMIFKLLVLGGIYNPDAVNPHSNPFIQLNLMDRIPGILALIGQYTAKVLWPAELSVTYYAKAFSIPDSWLRWDLFLGISILMILIGLAARRRRARPWILMSAVSSLPVIQLLQPIGAAFAERFVYLPLLFLLVGLAHLLPAKKLTCLIVVALIVPAVVRTHIRARDYRDNYTLFESAVRNTPESAMAHYNFGQELAERGELDRALQHFQRASEITPDDATIAKTIASLQARRGLSEDARRTLYHFLLNNPGRDDLFQEFVRMNPDPRDLLVILKRILEHDPENPHFHGVYGRYALDAGRPEEARIHLERALTLGLTDPYVYLLLAESCMKSAWDNKAIEALSSWLGQAAGEKDPGPLISLLLRSEPEKRLDILLRLHAAGPVPEAISCLFIHTASSLGKDDLIKEWRGLCRESPT